MPDLLAPAYGRYRTPISRIFGPVLSLNTYLRMAHLATMFPLGIAYFVGLAVSIAVGGALIWTFIGPVILILAMFLSRWAGDREAYLVHHIAHLDFRRPPTRLEPGLTWRQQLTTRLIDPSTWTGIVYLAVQFPIGIAMFVAVVAIGSISVAFTFAPLLIALDSGVIGNAQVNVDALGLGYVAAGTLDTPAEGLMFVIPGLLLFLFLLHFTLVATSLHAGWARLMLGSRARTSASPDGSQPPPTPLLPEPSAAGPPIELRSAEALEAGLTARELEVLGLMARGYSNSDIAETLVLSEGTVKTHVKRVLAKLRVHNRTEAALYAREHHIAYDLSDSVIPLNELRRRAP